MPDRELIHPFEMLDPEVAACVLGVKLEYVSDLSFGLNNRKYETAGILDRNGKRILIATRFGPEVARFTAAHELGHWLLHPGEVLHRDMPIKGLEREARDSREREADRFAASFLVPEHFISKVFKLRFLSPDPFVFDHNTAYQLRPYDVPSLLYPESGSLVRERVLSSAKSFNGHRFETSLAEMFRVSVTTMAIRIRELGLVRRWP
jgi:hypothetical protein